MLVLNKNNAVKIPRRGYKLVKSLFGQYEEIPEDWDLKKLEEIGKIAGGGTPDSTILEYWNGKILWAIPTDITKLRTNQIENTERKITKEGLDNSSAKLLPEGTILITSRATIGECAITKKPISTNQGFQSIICDDKNFNRTYIFYSIKCHKNELLRLAYGTTFLEINKTEIKKVMLPIPSVFEQQKIASILSGVDALIESTQKLIEKIKMLKKGLMQKLFTQGIDKTSIILSRLDSIIFLQRGHDLPNHKRRIGKIPVIGSNGIVGYHNESKSNGPGVLIGRSGTLGKVYYAEEDYWPLNTSLYVKEFYSSFPKFVFYLLQNLDYKKFNAGTSVPTLNRNHLHPFKLKIPININEQQKIASILSGVDAYIQKNQQYKERLEKLKKGLMQKLLTGQIRVKV